MNATPAFIHPSAEVSPQATIGHGTKIWHQAQVREDAHIGPNCIISKGVYVDFGVSIGANSKLQNGVYVYHGATVEDGVFLGPGVILTNDKLPRAINPDGSLKSDADWRWVLDREDCTWYPTMRLFRQKKPHEWEDVLGRVAGELIKCAAAGRVQHDR